MGKFIDLTGMEFGKLTVIEEAEPRRIGKKGVLKKYWRCQCECGNVKEICGDTLRTGKAHSCGCVGVQKFVERSTKHGFASERPRLYRIWEHMKDRCYNENAKVYKHYGGRGITICDEWHDFKNFYDWAMTHGYNDDLTIDRINVNGNYEPGNCRWVDWNVQANNTRRNVIVEIKTEKHTLKQWCDILNMPYGTVSSRRSAGWDNVDALLTPIKHKP